jgi:tripartite-type tricarboxylate transporter receptor subunit TctC
MKSFIKLLTVLSFGIVGAVGAAQSDGWTPPATVKIITSMPVGSGPDNALRKAAIDLSEKWKTAVVVENKPGGNGLVGMAAFNKEPAESTIFFGTVDNLAVYPVLTNQTDNIKNIEPFMGWLKSDMMLISPPGIKTVDQLKTAMQKNAAFGSWAVGSQSHVDGIVLSNAFGATPNHVPYKDYGMWFTDVSNGLMPFSFTTVASGRQLHAAGKLNFLAVNSAKRDPRYPDVPTLDEFVGKKVNVLNPYMIFATNANLSESAKKAIQADLVEVIQSNKMTAQLDPIGYLPWVISIPEFKKFYKAYGDNYLNFLKTNKIEIQ